MKRDSTSQEQSPSGTPLRAKYLTHKCAIIIVDLSDKALRQILDIIRNAEHPPHFMQ